VAVRTGAAERLGACTETGAAGYQDSEANTMTAPWQITGLSLKDADGNYVRSAIEGKPVILRFEAEEEFTTIHAELFRVKHDYERISARTDPWEAQPDEMVSTADVSNVYAEITITGHKRHETYVLVLWLDNEDDDPAGTFVIEVDA
jgi:hypothetical protein